ncbi:putative exported protein [Beauveria bassiana ARSEF 2860]|uniref:Putative exported protein n=1 Tax=Beauveria bassiana (strain ARSEF 2860) TaxID=655819 RepID=J4W3U4_BEAB2|nr:putative exported protein [Beauveria bassiana ARSEF 2860]EJP65090.1 putative exported protein [Beauveria bassiana ARSEF 2860]
MKLTHTALVAQTVLGLASANDKLKPWTYAPLPVGHVKPAGWLLGEMQAMATGLPGHEHDFYRFVNESSWLHKPGSGGSEYSSLNEALPYWFNGLVPTAYLLGDSRLKRQVHHVAAQVLSFQADDGWIGPETGDNRNFWARTPFFLGLIQLAEADKQWEQRIVAALQKFFQLANKMLRNDSQGFTRCTKDVDCDWGQVRVADMIITIQWLLENHASKNDNQLWDTMNLFYDQTNYKWDAWYDPATYRKVVDPSDKTITPYIHGVNVGQGKLMPGASTNPMANKMFLGLKASSVMWRFKGHDYYRERSKNAVDLTFTYHGSASGTILADEWQRDDSQYIGSELCTAVETSYSLAYMYQVLGDNNFADRAETTLFNAMPVMMTGDKWAHQYMSSPNMPFAVSTIQPDGSVPPVFTTANSGVATTYGLEPLYPCCTVNHPQGYPKFVTHSWVLVGNKGLGHALLGPTNVQTKVNGGDVLINCTTNYPFTNTLTYEVYATKRFDLYLRIPEWINLQVSTISMASTEDHKTLETSTTLEASNGKGMKKVSISKGSTTISYSLGMGPRVVRLADKTVAIFYGNLLYALDVGYNKTTSLPHSYNDPRGPGLDGLPFKELRDEFVTSTKEWNVAIDPSTIRYNGIGDDDEMADPIFEHNAPANFMTVDGCQIKWDLKMGVTPDRVPTDRTCISERKTYRLIPYGAAKVHMSHLPTVRL